MMPSFLIEPFHLAVATHVVVALSGFFFPFCPVFMFLRYSPLSVSCFRLLGIHGILSLSWVPQFPFARGVSVGLDFFVAVPLPLFLVRRSKFICPTDRIVYFHFSARRFRYPLLLIQTSSLF